MNRRLALNVWWKILKRTHVLCLIMLFCSLPAVGVPSDKNVPSNMGPQISTQDLSVSTETPAQSVNTRRKTILVIGDSLSAGYGIKPSQSWVTLLQDQIDTNHYPYKVINASISGETSQGGATRIKHLITQFTPDIILLELGGNDGLRGLPINIIKQSLETIITNASQQQIQLVLLGMRLPPNYGIQYTQQFENIYQELAKKYNTQLVPFLLQGFASDFKLIQADGIHPTAEAQPLILENVWPVLEPLLK